MASWWARQPLTDVAARGLRSRCP